MDLDLLFLFGILAYYLLRRMSKKGQKQTTVPDQTAPEGSRRRNPELRGRTSDEIVEEVAHADVPDFHAPVERSPEIHPAEPVSQSTPLRPALTDLMKQILGDPSQDERELEDSARHPWQSEQEFESGPSTGSIDKRFSDTAGSEWHTETKPEWTDQKSDFEFHSATEEQRQPHEKHRERSSVAREKRAAAKAEKRDARHKRAPARRKHESKHSELRRRLNNRVEVRDAFVLSELLGPPVSLRTRSAHRRLS